MQIGGVAGAHHESHSSAVEGIARSATARARTWDNHVNSVVLYQLSYGGSHCQVVGLVK